MKKITMAICDRQDRYREKLAEYFLCKRGGQLLVATYSVQRTFAEAYKERGFDIVLLGSGFSRPKEGRGTETLYLKLTEKEEAVQGKPQIPALFKYQPADEILRQIFEHYRKLEKEDVYICAKGKEIFGIYSPCHSSLRTPFALTMAQIFAQERRVMYVNLGEWAGFGQWFLEEYKRDLSDLLYMVSGSGNTVQGMLESVTCNMNGVDYIPPMQDAQMLCEAQREDYEKLLRLLVEKTDYEVLILDFGIMLPGFFSLLDKCSRIYGIVENGNLARCQRQQFETGIMRSDCQQLAEKLEYITFSASQASITEREPALQQWVYGELGDRARAIWGNGIGAS